MVVEEELSLASPTVLNSRSPTTERMLPMAELLLFHHAQGLTPGVIAFEDGLPSYDEDAAGLLTQRVLAFLDAARP
jgi:hypothetical protein